MVRVSETRQIAYVYQLREWLLELPGASALESIERNHFNGSVSLSWEERR